VTLRIVLLTIVCATAYGVSDEFHQRFVPGRTADVRDVAADAIGASAAALGAWAILKATAPHARRL
jgi:VanZ family protein